MPWLLLYDPETGDAAGRIFTNDFSQLQLYPNSVRLTSAEAEESPEVFHKVDRVTKKLKRLSPEELYDKGIVAVEVIDQKISEGKIPPWAGPKPDSIRQE